MLTCTWPPSELEDSNAEMDERGQDSSTPVIYSLSPATFCSLVATGICRSRLVVVLLGCPWRLRRRWRRFRLGRCRLSCRYWNLFLRLLDCVWQIVIGSCKGGRIKSNVASCIHQAGMRGDERCSITSKARRSLLLKKLKLLYGDVCRRRRQFLNVGILLHSEMCKRVPTTIYSRTRKLIYNLSDESLLRFTCDHVVSTQARGIESD